MEAFTRIDSAALFSLANVQCSVRLEDNLSCRIRPATRKAVANAEVKLTKSEDRLCCRAWTMVCEKCFVRESAVDEAQSHGL
jgi:hypothetical protein